MRGLGFILCGALAAFFVPPVAAQAGPEAEAAIAAAQLLRERLPRGTKLVVVPDTLGDTALAQLIGSTLAIPVRTAEEGRSCVGWIPHCTWSPGEGTFAVRLTPLSMLRDTVTLRVEHWTVTTESKVLGAPSRSLIYSRDRVLAVRETNRWLIRAITPEFST